VGQLAYPHKAMNFATIPCHYMMKWTVEEFLLRAEAQPAISPILDNTRLVHQLLNKA